VAEYAFDPSFISLVWDELFVYGASEFYAQDFLIALALGAVGAAGLIIRAFRTARTARTTVEWPDREVPVTYMPSEVAPATPRATSTESAPQPNS
jgi:hypothetical protein